MARTYEEMMARMDELEKAQAATTAAPVPAPPAARVPAAPKPVVVPGMEALPKPSAAPSAPTVTRRASRVTPKVGEIKAPKPPEVEAPKPVGLTPDLAKPVDYKKVYDNVYTSGSADPAVHIAARSLDMTDAELKRLAQAQGVDLDALVSAKQKGRTYDEIAKAGRERGVIGFMPVEEREQAFNKLAQDVEKAQRGDAGDTVELVRSGADKGFGPAGALGGYTFAGTQAELPEVAKPGEHGYAVAQILVDALQKDPSAVRAYDLYGRSLATGNTQRYIDDRVEDLRKRANIKASDADAMEKMAALRKRAINEVIAYKTVGQWTPVVTLGDVEVREGRASPGALAALKPNIEIIGFNNKRQAIFRQESPMGVLFRVIDIPQAAIAGVLSGQTVGQGIQSGANLLEYSLDATKDSAMYVKAPVVAAGFAASILFPDALVAAGAAGKAVKAVSKIRAARKIAPEATALLETIVRTRKAGDYEAAAAAEKQLRSLLPDVASNLDSADAAVARFQKLAEPESDILDTDLAALIAGAAPEQARVVAGRPFLHPSLRKFVVGPSGLEQADYAELFDTRRQLDRVQRAKAEYIKARTTGRSITDYTKDYIRGRVHDVFENLPPERQLSLTQVNRMADLISAQAPAALLDQKQFKKAVEDALKADAEFGTDAYKMARQDAYKAIGGRTETKLDEIRGKTIEELEAADMGLFDRAIKAIEQNNTARGVAAQLLRDEIAGAARLRVEPLELFDEVAPKLSSGEPIRLTPGGLLLLHHLRQAYPKQDFKEAYATITIIDKMIEGAAQAREVSPLALYQEIFPLIKRGTPEDLKRLAGDLKAGKVPTGGAPTGGAPAAPAAPTKAARARAEAKLREMMRRLGDEELDEIEGMLRADGVQEGEAYALDAIKREKARRAREAQKAAAATPAAAPSVEEQLADVSDEELANAIKALEEGPPGPMLDDLRAEQARRAAEAPTPVVAEEVVEAPVAAPTVEAPPAAAATAPAGLVSAQRTDFKSVDEFKQAVIDAGGAGFVTKQGSVYQQVGPLTQRFKTPHIEHDPKDVGLKKPSKRTIYLRAKLEGGGPDRLRETGVGVSNASTRWLIDDTTNRAYLVSRVKDGPVKEYRFDVLRKDADGKTIPFVEFDTQPFMGAVVLELFDDAAPVPTMVGKDKVADLPGHKSFHPGNQITEMFGSEAAAPPTPAPIAAAAEVQPEATIIPREVVQKLDEAKIAAPPPPPTPKGYSVMPNKGNNYEVPWTAYLSGKDSPDIRKVASTRDDLGMLITPYTSSYVKQAGAYPFFAVDNGVFAAKGFDPQKFEKLIGEVAALPEATRNKLLFVVAPDVLIKNPDGTVFGDAKGTLELFKQWGPKIRAKGLPVALVAQNGLEDMVDDIPWDDFDVLFIGGSTEWKIGDFSYIADPAARRATQDKWTKLFQAVYDNGKPIHMGRVSGPERLMRGGTEMGAATVDGTMLAVAPDQMMGKLIRMLDDLNVKGRVQLADQLYPDTGAIPGAEDFIALAQDSRVDVSDLDTFYRTVDAVAPGLVVNDTAPGLVKAARAEKRRVYEEVQRLRKEMAPPTQAKRKRASRRGPAPGGKTWIDFFRETIKPENPSDALRAVAQRVLAATDDPDYARSYATREATARLTGKTPEQILDAPPTEREALLQRLDVDGGVTEDDLVMHAAPSMFVDVTQKEALELGGFPKGTKPEDITPEVLDSLIDRVAEIAAQVGGGSALEPRLREMGGGSVESLADVRYNAKDLQDRIVPMNVDQAFDFVRKVHSKLPEPRPQGLLEAVGVAAGGDVRVVGLLNTPPGPFADQSGIVELSRVASDGKLKNGSSAITYWAMQNLQRYNRSGDPAKARLVTTSLLTEPGEVYKALEPEGLHPTSLVNPSEGTGSRAGAKGTARKGEWKINWEFGPAAAPEAPHLYHLQPVYRDVVVEGKKLSVKRLNSLVQRPGTDLVAAYKDAARVLGVSLKDEPVMVAARQAFRATPEGRQAIADDIRHMLLEKFNSKAVADADRKEQAVLRAKAAAEAAPVAEAAPAVKPAAEAAPLLPPATAPHRGSTFSTGKQAQDAAADNRAVIQTPEFKQWFGDSKVVDEAGAPLVVFRGGTPTDVISTTDTSAATQLGRGAYFGGVGLAEDFASFRPGGEVGAYYLALRNPFDETRRTAMPTALFSRFKAKMRDLGAPAKALNEIDTPYLGVLTDLSKDVAAAKGMTGSDAAWRAAEEVNAALRELGFDGIIADWNRGGGLQYVAFEPTQIKSATANVGTFSPTDPSILKQVSPTGAVKGAVEWLEDGSSVVYLFEGADASTVLHEVAHVVRRNILSNEDMGFIASWVQGLGVNVGHQYGEFTGDAAEIEKAEELFAKAFEQYVAEGKAPVGLEGAFAQLKDAVANIYKAVKDPVIGVELQPEVRRVFDGLFATEPKQADQSLKEAIRRGILGGPEAEVDILTVLSREAKRKGLDQFSPDELATRINEAKANIKQIAKRDPTGTDVVLKFETKVLGKDKWTINDLAAAQAARDARLAPQAEARMALLRDMTGKGRGKAAIYKQDTAVESLWTALSSKETDAPMTKQAKKALRGVASLYFGGNVLEETKMAGQPPAFRRALDTSARIVEQSLADTVALVNDAVATGDDTQLLRYLTGDSDVAKVSGRPILSSGHDKMGAVNRMIQRAIAAFKDDEKEALIELADAINTKDPVERGQKLVTLGFTASGGEVSFKEADEARKAMSDALRRAVGKLLYPEKKDADIGTALASAIRDSVNAPDKARPSHELRLVETLTYIGGVTARDGDLFKGDSKDVVRTLLGDIRKIYGEIGEESARRVAVQIGAFGGADQAKQFLVRMGLGVDEKTQAAFARFLNGEQPGAENIAGVDRMLNTFGRDIQFVPDAALDVDFYIPRAARERMAQVLSRAQFRTEESVGAADALATSYRYMKTRMTRGNFFIRQRYFMMNTVDHFNAMAYTEGFGIAAASTARVIAQDLLVVPLMREILEVGKAAGVLSPVATERLRSSLQKLGDRAAGRIGKMMSVSKYRIEVNPILEGVDGGFTIGGKVYRYRDIRDIAVEEGVFSSFDTRELQRAILREGQLVLGDAAAQKAVVRSPTRLAWMRNGLASLEESVSDIAEAWGERERLGAMVTLMEAGYDPRAAAQITVKALFDYSQSMTKLDRLWLVNLLLPFWAFQKNANQQVFNMLFSPWGGYRMMVVKRARERTSDLLGNIMYNTLVDDYGVDVESMPPELQDSYYATIKAFEEAFGPDGPPPEAKRAMRMLLSGRAIDVEDGVLMETSAEIQRLRSAGAFADLARFIPFTVAEPSKAGRSSIMRDRAGFPVPFPRSEGVRTYNALLGDNHSYMELYWPDSTIEAGMKWHTQVAATMFLLAAEGAAETGLTGLREGGIDEVTVQRVLQPIIDVERSPLIAPFLEQPPPKRIAAAATPEAWMKVHPMLGKMLDDVYGTTFLRVPAVADPLLVDEDGNLPQLTPDQITEIKRLQEQYPDIGVLKNQRYYLPGGVWATAFENSPLGELNALLLRWEEEPLESQGRQTIQGKILIWSRKYAGVDVTLTAPSQAAKREEPRKKTETAGTKTF